MTPPDPPEFDVNAYRARLRRAVLRIDMMIVREVERAEDSDRYEALTGKRDGLLLALDFLDAGERLAKVEDDALEFGVDAIVYCRSHMRPHLTGWCSVGVRNKVALESGTISDALDECREKGYPIYGETPNTRNAIQW